MATDHNIRRHEEFNEALIEAIDETLRDLFSYQVQETLYKVLSERYDVSRDEVPYRLETLYKILKDIFGIRGGGTLSRSISRRLYEKLKLPFEESPNLELMDYVEIAKNKLLQAPSCTQPSSEAAKSNEKRGW